MNTQVIIKFYDSAWAAIMVHIVSYNTFPPEYLDFQQLCVKYAKNGFGDIATWFNPVGEFEKNVSLGYDKYNADRAENYAEFMNFPENMALLKKHTRKPPATNTAVFARLLALQKSLIGPEPVIEAKLLFTIPPPEPPVSIRRCMELVTRHTEYEFVSMKHTNIYDKIVNKYLITHGGVKLGEVYIYITNTTQGSFILTPKSSSLGAKTLIMCNETIALTHELTNAIQFCLHDFWDITFEYRYIASTVVLNRCRKDVDQIYPNMRISLAFSLADLASETPEQFNENFEKYSRTKNAGMVVARFRSYITHDKIYWTLFAGLFDLISADPQKLLESNGKDINVFELVADLNK